MYAQDPNLHYTAKNIERKKMNGIFHDITEAVGEIQTFGASQWAVEGQPYPLRGLVYHKQKLWQSRIDNNKEEPKVGTAWVELKADLTANDVGAYSKEESDGRYESKGVSYTKGESDGRYESKGESYTKGESDGRYESKGVSYTKGESDERYQSKGAGRNVRKIFSSLVTGWGLPSQGFIGTMNFNEDVRGKYLMFKTNGGRSLLPPMLIPVSNQGSYRISWNNWFPTVVVGCAFDFYVSEDGKSATCTYSSDGLIEIWVVD